MIEDDGRGCPFQLLGDGARGGAYLTKPHLLLALGTVVLQATDDDDASVHLRERFLHRLLLVLVSGGLLVTAATIELGRPTKKALHHVIILELVTHRIAVVGARLLLELVEVIVPGRALILAVGRRDHAGGGRPAVLLVLPIIVA